MLVAAYCFRYEPDWMIDQLRENLHWVDGFADIDTRTGFDDVLWIPRAQRLALMQEKAGRLGARWVLHVDPDERLENRAEKVIRRALERPRFQRYAFQLYELWDTPDQYRIDGVWGAKWRRRLYRYGCDPNAYIGRLKARLYHLATIEPANRQMRVAVHTDHNTWDNQTRGFAYLADEQRLLLEQIPRGRGYSPPYRKYEKKVPGY